MCVCVCVRACVRACVRVCGSHGEQVTQVTHDTVMQGLGLVTDLGLGTLVLLGKLGGVSLEQCPNSLVEHVCRVFYYMASFGLHWFHLGFGRHLSLMSLGACCFDSGPKVMYEWAYQDEEGAILKIKAHATWRLPIPLLCEPSPRLSNRTFVGERSTKHHYTVLRSQDEISFPHTKQQALQKQPSKSEGVDFHNACG